LRNFDDLKNSKTRQKVEVNVDFVLMDLHELEKMGALTAGFMGTDRKKDDTGYQSDDKEAGRATKAG